MPVFKSKAFSRFARKEGIDDRALNAAIDDVERGLIYANLGGGVVKQRIARSGEGKSGGFRVIILYKPRTAAFFVYGFAKNERDNIEKDELAAFKALATELLAYDDKKMETAIRSGVLVEIKSSQKETVSKPHNSLDPRDSRGTPRRRIDG